MLETLAAYGWVALGGGLVAAALFVLVPASRRLALPPFRRRAVAWRGIDVWVVFCILQIFGPWFVIVVLQPIGVLTLLFPNADQPKSPDALRRSLFISMVSAPVTLLLALGYLLRYRQVPPYQIGLTRARWAPSLMLGYFTWLVVTPAVFGIQYLVIQYLLSSPDDARAHDLARVLDLSLSTWELVLVLLLPLLAAPILEELFFRGILLPWQVRAAPLSHFVVAAGTLTAALAMGVRDDQLFYPPALFMAAMLLGYLLLPWFASLCGKRQDVLEDNPAPRSGIQRWIEAIEQPALDPRRGPLLAAWGNGLLFAAMHSKSWPDPVPLVLLGCSLAWLRLRTQSLLAPVFVHFLFNLVGVLVALLYR